MQRGPASHGGVRALLRRLTRTSVFGGLLVVALPVVSRAAPPTTNQIIPTGRTATAVSVSGQVTNITTTTMSGGNAYNDFSKFSTAPGTIVNLQVPSAANNLINIVHDAPAYVGGTLNSYKDGHIGGNVVFADPYGFIVGRQGIVNVGSLMVRTPTKAFINRLISSTGHIDNAAAQALLAGDIPLSPDGRVSIRGKVNARHNVSFLAHSIAVGRDPASVHAIKFASTVNVRGLRTGAAIVARNGSIDIVAADRVSINGRVATRARAGRNAGPINIKAGGDIRFGSNAEILARGLGAGSSGGHIDIQGSQNLSIVAGALFDASAGTSGNGGIIEISAAGKQTLGGGTYSAAAPGGTPGKVVFDPALTEISGVNTTVGGTDFIDTASSIIVDASAVIVTRQVASGADPTDPTVASTGDSGNIALNATGGSITINPGAQLLTFATNAYKAGDITLNAGSNGTISFPTDPNLTSSALFATRVIPSGAGASLTDSASSGDSGNITLIGGSLALGTGINTAATSSTAPGERFLANAAAATCAAASTAGCAGFNPGTITFQVGSFSFDPAAPILTEGANLAVVSSGTVSLPAGTLINTRHQASAETDTSGNLSTTYFSPTDPTSSILDTPGNVTITADAVSYPTGINTAGGAAIYAGGYGGSYGFLPGTITLNVPNLTVGGTIGSAGAHLVLNATSGQLTVDAGAVIDTREVAAGSDAADPTIVSKNVSGDLTLTSTAGNDIVIGAGAKLLTFSTDQYYAGNITLSAGRNLIFQAPGIGQAAAELVARSVSSTAAATDGFYAYSSANSGDITLSAGSGAVELNGGLNSGTGPTVLAGARIGGAFAYAPGTVKMSAPSITVAAGTPFDALGANLDLEATSAITVAANAIIDTRDVGTGFDPAVLTNGSTGNSGNVTLHAPTITVGAGGTITASAVGSNLVNGVAVAARAGNVTIKADSSLSLAAGAGGSAAILARAVASGAASIAAGTADAAGGTIAITAPSLNLANGINTGSGVVLLAAGGNGNAAGTIALTASSLDVSTTIRGLGANVALTASSGNVTLENSAVVDTTVMNGAAGNITIAGTSVVLPNNAVNEPSSVSLLASATGGNSPGTITFSETGNLDYNASSLAVNTFGAGFVLRTAGTLSLGPNLSIDSRDLSGSTVVGPAGDVSLVADTIDIGGGINGSGTATILASGGNGHAPGTITLEWTGTAPVTLGGAASFNGAGANLAIVAPSATIEDSATLNAGNKNTVSVFGKTVQLTPTSVFDAGAVKFGETSASSNFDITSSLSFAGIDLSIATDGSITVEQGVILSTRKTTTPFAATPDASTGNSGSITLSAPTITVLGTLDAGVTNASGTTWTAGDVSLTALQIEQPVAGFGNTTATTAISIGNSSNVAAVINGANINIIGTATSDSEPFSTLLTGYVTLGGSGLLQSLGQINGAVQLATATSTTHVYGGATINGTGNVSVQAVANTTASNVTPDTPYFINIGLTGESSGFLPSLPRAIGLPLNATFAVMEATGTATALVDSGATIKAGGTLTVRAHNTDTIHSEESITSTNNTVDIAVAYSHATINSTAIINSGANITAGAVRVTARNDNSWNTTADVADMGQGKGGIVLALSENDTSNATALMNADLTLPPTPPAGADAGLLVDAQSVTEDNVVSASAESGSGDFAAKALGAIGGNSGGLASKLNDKLGGQLNNVFSNNKSTQKNQIRFAFGVALNIGNTQTATAKIGGTTADAVANGYTPARIPPPTVNSPGAPVAVTASVEDNGLQTQALSTIRSTTYGTSSTSFPGTTYGFGGAFALTELTHTSLAELGTQASVTAPAVGIDSNIYVPLSLPIADWSTPKAIMENILGFLPTVLENSTAEVDTTGANAVANAQQLGVAGAVDIYTLNDNSKAWVGQGASITARPASTSAYLAGPWTVVRDTGNDDNAGIAQPSETDAPMATWTGTVGVTAEDTVAAINIGGGIDFLGILHPAKSTSSTAGAAFSETNFTQTTVAGIGSEATIDTAGQLSVDATTLDYIITLVPSATNSGALALSGMVGLSILDNNTDAAISNTAAITADLGLTIEAAQYLNSSIVGGALFQMGSTVAFGVGIGINLPTTDTEAFIGDTTYFPGTTTVLDPTAAPDSSFTAPTAKVTTPSANVFALTAGQVLSLGLAGSLTSSGGKSHDTPTNTSASSGNGDISSNPKVNGIADKLAFLDNVLPNWPSGPELPKLPQFGLAVSGSAAVDQVALTTKAYIDGATVKDPNTGASDSLSVSAVRNLWLIAGAGGFAASTASDSQTNVDVAGALALDISNNTTEAYIQSSNVSGYHDVQVAALEGGQQIDVGLDLAATFASGGTSVGVAVSASIGIVNDRVAAWISGSTVTGQGGGAGTTSVLAYDNTNIGMGGGAFIVNFGSDGGGSAGAGVTIGEINDPSSGYATDAYIDNSTLTQFGAVSVEAASAGRIIMGAISGSVTDKSTGVGAVTYAQIAMTTNAAITNSTVNVTNSVSVQANGGDQSTYDSELSKYGRVAYSSISDFSGSQVLSVLDSSPTNVAPTQIGTGGAAIIAVAGTFSIEVPGSGSKGANANIGLQLTINDIGDTYSATIADSTVTTAKTGSVDVAANDSATILGISAGAAVSASSGGGFNLTGLASLTINLISDHATATVGDASGTQYSTSISTGSLSVTANNAAITDAFAGNVDISTSSNSAAFGAAIAFAEDTQHTAALLTNSKLNVDGETAVQAATNPVCTSNCPVLPYTIADAAFAVAASGNLAFAGAITANVIENTTSATATANSLNDPAVWGTATAYSAIDGSSLVVTGSDNSTIGTFAISVAGGNTVGVGAGISYGDIANTVSAAIDGDNGADTNHPAIIVGGVLVQATSTPTIETLAAGVGGGESGGVGGSIVTNFVGIDPSLNTVKTATASIDQNAIVSALGNVYVLSLDNSAIEVIAGSLGVSAGGEPGVGIGVGLIVNSIKTASTAQIDDSTVDAAGQTTSTTVGGVGSVNDGTLSAASGNAPDVSQITAPRAVTYALAENQKTLHGLAVDATADEQVIANTVSIGLQISPEPGVGADVNVLVNLLGGTTTASITDSNIDTTTAAETLPTGTARPDVFVNASSHMFTGNFVVAAAGSLYVAGAATADASQVVRTTKAFISGGSIGSIAYSSESVTNPYQPSCAQQNCSDGGAMLTTTTLTPEASIGTVTVNAATTADTADIAVGASAAAAAGAGTVIVDIFSPTTNAYIVAGTPVVAINLDVAATTENGNNMLGGAAAGGGSAIAGSFGVLVSNDTTDAYIGDQANKATDTTLTLTGTLSVNSTMTDNFNSLVVSGSAAGGVGIAGMADVLVVTNHTTAGLYLVTVGQTGSLGVLGAPPAKITNTSAGVYEQTVTNEYGGNADWLAAPSSIQVNATEIVKIAANAGSLGIGISGAGLGAGATVIVLKSNTTALAYDDWLNTTGSVQVTATSTKSIQAIAVSLGAGSSAGIGASALLVLVGTAPSGGLNDINNELNANGTGTLSSVDNAGTNGTSGSAHDSTQTPAAPSYSVTDTINNGSTDAVTASVEGGTVTADQLSVTATSNISTSSIVGGAGLSLGLGVGGGVGYTLIYDTVTATAYGGIFTANDISIQALAQDATPVLSSYPGTANVMAIAGGAGLVGLGAAYANGTVHDNVTASIGGTVGTNANLQLAANTCANNEASCLTVSGSDTATITVGAYGAEVGAAAAGVVVGQAEKTSTVGANVLDNSVLSGFAVTTVSGNQSGALSVTTVGAAGGLLAAGTGAASTATTLSQVTASTGSDVTLPDGDFTLQATNDPRDTTSALGVAAGGLFAAGVGVAISDAGNTVSDTTQPIDQTQSIYTAVALGSGTVTHSNRTGALNLNASSVSAVSAEGTAGAGGGVAGAAAVGETNDTALTTVALNQPAATLHAGTMTLSATHTTNFAGQSNSVAASVLGGSGSQTNNTVDASTTTSIADNSVLKATGAVSINASDVLMETLSGDAANGAGGGVLNGSASLVDGEFTLDAAVTLGTGVKITSGTDPVLNPGAIAVGAGILVNVGDTATLNTGGVLDGAASQNKLTLTTTTNVEIGSNDNLYSQGALGIGSYVQVEQASPQAYSNTYGLAAIGDAHASATVTANQTTHIGQGATINGLGSVWVTAGLDPSGSVPTILNSSPNAQAYAYGLVGVPIVDATANLTSNTTFTVDSATWIASALNVTIGGYPGAPSAVPSAAGAGDILGVPTTTGTATPTTSTSSVVTMNGTAVAGEYNTLLITVDPTQCLGDGTCSQNESQGFPTSITYDPSEDLGALVRLNFPTDPAQAAALASVPMVGAPTVTIGTLFAAGGLVYVNAGTLSGNGKLQANGGPTITVQNWSNAFLVVGPVMIPNQAGGSVIFTGSAGALSDPALTVAQSVGNTANILINSTGSGTTGGVAPGMIFTGPITAVTGNITLNNANGSIATALSVIGLSVTISAPNGIDVIGNGASQQYLASNPFSEWDASILWPGGNPGQVTPNADLAIAYAANAIDPCCGAYGSYSESLYGVANGTSGSHSGAGSGSYGYNYVSQVWYGNCGPASYGDCSSGNANTISSIIGGSGTYAIDPNGGPNYYYFTAVPVETLNVPVSAVPNTAAFTNATGGIVARQIVVQGSFIAVAGQLVVGSPTQVSIDIPASFDPILANLHANGGGATYTMSSDSSGNPLLSYDSGQDQLILSNINAAATASQIVLDGKILGVNPDAMISVNTGLGSVVVTNETGVPLTVNNINVGSNASNLTSTVQIIDTLSATNNVYRYTTGRGLQRYETNDLSYICTAGIDCTNGAPIINTNDATYTPQAGSRLTWTLRSTLTRTVSTDGTYQDWSFLASGLTTNPWQYVSGGSLTGTATAQYTKSANPNDPAFSEQITASENGSYGVGVTYHGCDSSGCHYGFPSNSTKTDSKGGNTWLYLYPNNVTLDLNVTVRADYAFGIKFGGSTTGSINVNTNSPLTVAGTLFNPDGTTTLTSTGSAPSAAVNGGLASTVPNGIYAAGGAQIEANRLSLTTSGPLGRPSIPVPVTLTQSAGNGPFGTLNASSGSDGVYLDIKSGATIGQITSLSGATYGDVIINSEFGLTATSGITPAIMGRNITVTVAAGGIGSSALPFNIQPNGTGGTAGGIVNVAALGDIYIERDNGDLLVGAIISLGGDVTIGVPDGALLDAAGQTPLSVLLPSQVAAIEAALGISATGEAGAAVNANTVNPVQNTINGYYAQYWNLVSTLLPNGSVAGTLYAPGSTFALTQTAQILAVYTPLAQQAANATARANGLTPTTVTTADVVAYANGLYQNIVSSYAPAFARYYGTSWQSLPAFTAQSSAPNVFSSAQIQAFELDPQQSAAALLNSAISYNALQPAGPAVIGIGSPNVVGRTINVTQARNIGKLGTPVDIAFSSILNGTLTTTEAEALALATKPGQASFVVQERSGPPITIPITELSRDSNGQYYYTAKGQSPVAVTVTGVEIQEPAPVFLSTNGEVNLNTAGSVFVESTIPTLPIGTITAHGDVTIAAPQSLISARPVGQINIVTSDGGVSLAAGTGSIGAANLPLTLKVANAASTGALTSVSAGQDAYLNYVGSDLTIGSVFAGGLVSITAEHGIFGSSSALSITGADIHLEAQGDIGSATAALQLQVKPGGALSGFAQGAAYVFSPTEANRAPVTLTVSNFTAGTDLHLGADASVDADEITAKAGALVVAGGADTRVTNATAKGPMTLSAVEDLTVGGLTTTGGSGLIKLTTGATGAVTVLTGRSVSGAGITAQSATFGMDAGAALAAAGPVNIDTAGDAVLGSIQTSIGGITVTADLPSGTANILSNGDTGAALTAAGAGGNVALSATDDIGAPSLPIYVATPLLSASSARGGIWIVGAGDLDATLLSAPHGAVSLTATGMLTVTALDAGLTGTLTGGTGLTVGPVTTGGDALLTASLGDLTVTGPVTSHGGATFDAQSGAVSLTTVTADNFIAANAGKTLTVDTFHSGGTQTLNAGGEVDFTLLTTTGTPTDPGDVDITALGTIHGGDIDAAGSVSLNGVGVAFGTILAGGNATVVSTGDIIGQKVDVGGDITLQAGNGSNGTLNVGSLVGNAIELDAGGSITVSHLTVGTALKMHANVINAGVTQSPLVSTPLVLDVTGPGGGLAHTINLNIDAPNGLDIAELAAIDANLVTTANTVVGSFDVPGVLHLQTAQAILLLDDINPTTQPGIKVQLYQPGGHFYLDQSGMTTLTDAYITAFEQAYTVIETAFDAGHADASPYFQGTSSARDGAWNTDYELRQAAAAATGFDVFAAEISQLFLQGYLAPVTTEGGLEGPAVNLGSDGGSD